MQVNRATFPATFPHFAALLETCDFYALDEEMTGISAADAPESILDSPAASYAAKRAAATRYSMMQCGICLFHRVPSSAAGAAPAYVARPFNFLLFPHGSSSSDVTLSPSTFAFLQRHGMDFQSWVADGIGFCDRHAEAVAEAGDQKPVTASAGELAKMRAWLLDGDKAWLDAAAVRATALAAEAADGGAETAVAVLPAPAPSRAVRECLTAQLASTLPSVTVAYRRSGGSGGGGSSSVPASYTAVLTAVSASARARREAEAALVARRAALDVRGFRHVFAALVASGKPCVVHNGFADWLFLLAALDGPLPATLPLFKGRLHSLFPCVFDTKYLSARADLFPPGRFGSTHLGGLFAQYAPSSSTGVSVTLPLGFAAYDPLSLLVPGSRGRGPAHEAGYDALMTGTVFAHMLREAGLTLEAAAGVSGGVVNRLALFRSLFALDVVSPSADEYVPGAAFLVSHGDGVRAPHVESCLDAAAGTGGARVHAVDEAASVVAFPRTGRCPTEDEMRALLQAHATRVQALAPETLLAPTTTASQFAFPTGGGGGALLRSTLPRLLMRAFR